MSTLRVTVVGGGVGGLFVGRALSRLGAAVTVLEQAPALKEVGAGLQLAPNATRLLARAGLLEMVAAKAVRPEASYLKTAKSGLTVLKFPLGDEIEARHGAPYLHVHRADLLDCFAEAAKAADVAIRLNARVSEVSETSCKLDDGQVVDHDLLIGADGARSTTRQQVFPDAAPIRFTGSIAWRATIPTLSNDTRFLTEIWMGPGRHLVAYKLRGGALTNLVAVEDRDEWVDESWSMPGDPAQMRRAFDGFGPRPGALLSAVKNCFRWGIFNHPAPSAMAKGNIALIGDAAHAAPPFGAQGAAMAIEDGAALAVALKSQGDVQSALNRYSEIRCKRVNDVLNWSLSNGRMFHQSNPLLRIARYGYMGLGSRLAPNVANMRMDWLYGYDAEQHG